MCIRINRKVIWYHASTTQFPCNRSILYGNLFVIVVFSSSFRFTFLRFAFAHLLSLLSPAHGFWFVIQLIYTQLQQIQPINFISNNYSLRCHPNSEQCIHFICANTQKSDKKQMPTAKFSVRPHDGKRIVKMKRVRKKPLRGRMKWRLDLHA